MENKEENKENKATLDSFVQVPKKRQSNLDEKFDKDEQNKKEEKEKKEDKKGKPVNQKTKKMITNPAIPKTTLTINPAIPKTTLTTGLTAEVKGKAKTKFFNTYEEFMEYIKRDLIGDMNASVDLEVMDQPVRDNNTYQGTILRALKARQALYGKISYQYSGEKKQLEVAVNGIIDRKMKEIERELTKKFGDKLKIINDKLTEIKTILEQNN